jgi:hypothetical protein
MTDPTYWVGAVLYYARGGEVSKVERIVLAVLIGGAMLWVGLADTTDPTPEVIRLPIGIAASVGLGWFVWGVSGAGKESESDER